MRPSHSPDRPTKGQLAETAGIRCGGELRIRGRRGRAAPVHLGLPGHIQITQATRHLLGADFHCEEERGLIGASGLAAQSCCTGGSAPGGAHHALGRRPAGARVVLGTTCAAVVLILLCVSLCGSSARRRRLALSHEDHAAVLFVVDDLALTGEHPILVD